MARDPHSTDAHQDGAGVWLARIRSDTARRVERRREDRIDPLLERRLRETADAAMEASEKAARAARAADRAVGLSDLVEAFGRGQGPGPGELRAAANRSIEAAVEARDQSEEAAARGRLARLAAQDEATAREAELRHDAALGELWHE